MRKLLMIVWLVSLVLNVDAQQLKMIPFELNGKINADTDTVYLNTAASSDYYPGGKRTFKAKVINGEFKIKGVIPYPEAYQLYYERYQSGVFLIEPGVQLLNVNIDSNRKIPEVDNQVMKEYPKILLAGKAVAQASDLLDVKWKELNAAHQEGLPPELKLAYMKDLQANYNESDRQLLAYATDNPDSYPTFWRLIRLMDFGYQDIFQSIYPKFSDSLKNTYAGKVLAEKLKASKILSKGKKFPILNVVNAKGAKLSASGILKNQYTLVDFWYSNCSPCIATFPGLIEVYKKYKKQGFEVIGISVDKAADKVKWQTTINKHKISWPHFLDASGIESAKLSIVSFPTNYLLDQKGEIVAYNFSDVQLDEFLGNNLKK